MGKRCQVEGCTEDLEALGRPYLIKKKICAQHMRAEVVKRTGGGSKLWRFCQQCGKLEPLTCFDGSRRNCRNSLKKRRHPTDKLQDSEQLTDQECVNAHKQGRWYSDPTEQTHYTAEHAMHGDAGCMSDGPDGTDSLTAAAPEDANSQPLPTVNCNVGAAAAVAAAAKGATYQPPSLDMAWMQIQQQQQQMEQMQQMQLIQAGLNSDGGYDASPLSTQLSAGVTGDVGCHPTLMMTAGTGLGLQNHSLASSLTAAAESSATNNNNTGRVTDMHLEAVMMQELLTVLNEGGVSSDVSNQQLPVPLPQQQQQQQQVPLFTATGPAAAAKLAPGLSTMLPVNHARLTAQISANTPAAGYYFPTAIPAGATAAHCQLSSAAAAAMPAGMVPLVACRHGSGSSSSSSGGTGGGLFGLAGGAAAAAPAATHQYAFPTIAAQQQQQRRAHMASRLQMLTARVAEMQDMLRHLQQSVATSEYACLSVVKATDGM